MTSTERSTVRRAGTVLLWLLIGLETLGMGAAGWSKFGNPGGWTSMFEGWGYPGWFAFVIGGAELACALLLLAPRLASYAGSTLVVIMLGALSMVLLHPGGRMGPGIPLIHIAVLSVIIVARWRRRWTPRSRFTRENAV